MTNIYSSGNEIVGEVGEIHFTGNIVLTIWSKTIDKENGKPMWLAIFFSGRCLLLSTN